MSRKQVAFKFGLASAATTEPSFWALADKVQDYADELRRLGFVSSTWGELDGPGLRLTPMPASTTPTMEEPGVQQALEI